MQDKIPLREKIILLFLGGFLFIFALEMSLRASGFIYKYIQAKRNFDSIKEKGDYRIMCIGESTTALGGKFAYPRQLEEILNQAKIGIKFSVINEGVPGITTEGIAKKLGSDLDRYRPDLVVAMIGVNDNSIEWSQVVKPYKKKFNEPGFIDDLKSYKLFRWVKNNLEHKYDIKSELIDLNYQESKSEIFRGIEYATKQPNLLKEADSLRLTGHFKEAVGVYKKIIKIEPLNYEAHKGLGWVYECLGDHDSSILEFKELVKIDKSNYHGYHALAHVYPYLNKYNEAIEMLKKVIELNPNDNDAYISLADCYIALGNYASAQSSLEDAIKNRRNDRAYGRFGLMLSTQGNKALSKKYFGMANRIRSEYFFPETLKNFKRIKKTLDENGIRIVVVQYPMRSLHSLLRIWDGEKDIVFVDNEASFKKAVNNQGYKAIFWDTFGGDFGHCTPEGNRILAKNIADVILNNFFNK